MDPANITQAATAQSGWIAGLLAAVMLTGLTVLTLIVRQLWSDHRKLNVFVRTELLRAFGRNTTAFTRLAILLGSRPCLIEDADELETIDQEASAPSACK